MGMLVVANRTGRVIAAVHAPHKNDEIQFMIHPLKGQRVAHVEIPQHLHKHEPHDQLRAVLKLHLHAGAKVLSQLPKKRGSK